MYNKQPNKRSRQLAGVVALAAALAAGTVQADWGGKYAGVSVGMLSGQAKLDSDENGTPVSMDLSGTAIGLFYGKNERTGRWVDGWEIGLAFNTADGAVPDWAGSGITEEIKLSGRMRRQIGYVFGPVMPYLAAGVAVAGTETTVVDVTGREAFGRVRVGFTLALGAEYALGKDFTLRAELVRDEYATSSMGSYTVMADSLYSTLRTSMFRLGAGMNF